MVDPVTATITIVGWFLSPVISFAVNKALDHLNKPLKHASAYDAELNKLEELIHKITDLLGWADDIKVLHHQHQIELRNNLEMAVLEAQRYTLNFNRRYKQLLELEAEAPAAEAEAAAGTISTIKRWKIKVSLSEFGLRRNLSMSIKGWQEVERIAKDFIDKSLATTAHEGREVVIAHKRMRDTEADPPNKKMKINGAFEGKDRAENGEGINPIIHRERMDSQIVEFGTTPLEMCQYAKEVFAKSCPSPLREEFAQCQFEDIAARMTKVAFEVGVAAATLWQRCQELDLIFKGKVLPPQIEKKDLEDDKNNKSEEGSSSKD